MAWLLFWPILLAHATGSRTSTLANQSEHPLAVAFPLLVQFGDLRLVFGPTAVLRRGERCFHAGRDLAPLHRARLPDQRQDRQAVRYLVLKSPLLHPGAVSPSRHEWLHRRRDFPLQVGEELLSAVPDLRDLGGAGGVWLRRPRPVLRHWRPQAQHVVQHRPG